jgi:hypothetical protein
MRSPLFARLTQAFEWCKHRSPKYFFHQFKASGKLIMAYEVDGRYAARAVLSVGKWTLPRSPAVAAVSTGAGCWAYYSFDTWGRGWLAELIAREISNNSYFIPYWAAKYCIAPFVVPSVSPQVAVQVGLVVSCSTCVFMNLCMAALQKSANRQKLEHAPVAHKAKTTITTPRTITTLINDTKEAATTVVYKK